MKPLTLNRKLLTKMKFAALPARRTGIVTGGARPSPGDVFARLSTDRTMLSRDTPSRRSSGAKSAGQGARVQRARGRGCERVSKMGALATRAWLALAAISLTAKVSAQEASSSAALVPAAAVPAASETKPYGRAPSRAQPGFSLLAAMGSGTNTDKVHRVHMEPYAMNVGIVTGYTFRNGVYLGAYGHYALGRSVTQQYDPRFGESYDYTADSTSLNAGAAVAYDLPLYMFVLRYTLNLGVTRFTWDFDEAQDRIPAGFGGKSEGTQLGFHLGPALGLLWTWRILQCGLVYEYLVQFQDRIPSGLVGNLLIGVKL